MTSQTVPSLFTRWADAQARAPGPSIPTTPGEAAGRLPFASSAGKGAGTATVAEYTVRLVELLPERPGPGVTADDYVALLRVDGAGAAESSATPFPKSGA
jgi:hypothetical protein